MDDEDDESQMDTSKDWNMVYIFVGVVLALILILAIWFIYRNKCLYEKNDDKKAEEPKVVTLKDLREKDGGLQLTENS
jgi:flagellar biosynthesis/type III secretory pathway M-ring protein FliF/YscJ